jgi:RNA polymerase sigma-70 factor (ECF subfamily)
VTATGAAPRPPELTDDDVTLVIRVRAGDEAALAALYRRHAAMVLNLAFRVTRERTTAEEACQQVFLHLWGNAEVFDTERGQFRSWLGMLAYRRAVDLVRREASQRRLSQRQAAEAVTEPDRVSSAEEAAVDRAVAERVRSAVNRLPTDQRMLVQALYFRGLTVREIAEAHGLPEGTVKTRLRSARQKLGRLLGAEGLVALP